MSIPLIKIENVIKTYTIGDTTFNALDGVSLDIYEKEFEDAASEYDQIMTDYSDYPNLCIKVGEIRDVAHEQS